MRPRFVTSRLHAVLLASSLAAGALSCGSEGPTEPPPPPPVVSAGSIVVTPATGWVMRGVPYTLAAAARDAAGAPVSEASITYASSDNAIATVSGAGVVQPLAAGTVTITATGASGRTGTATITVTEKRTVTGMVTTADGQSPTGLAITARVGTGAATQRFSAPVQDGTGTFSIDTPIFPASAGVVDYYVDASGAAARTYHPSLYRLAAGASPSASYTVLLVPQQITIDSGTFAGHRVAVSLNKAFVPVCTTPGEANCQSYWPSYWLGGIKMWPEGARPIPLAIDRTGVATTITESDSIALWTTIRQMEADLGRRLYQPATFSGYTSPGYQVGQVLVTIDVSLSATSGYTNWSWNGLGQLTQARTRLGSVGMLSSRFLVSHELTHGLGFSHTCQWATVMGGYGCGGTVQLSEQDVAYHHLAQLVRRRTGELQPSWGLAEALAGERALELQLPLADAIPTSLRAALLPAPVAGSDSSAHGGTR